MAQKRNVRTQTKVVHWHIVAVAVVSTTATAVLLPAVVSGFIVCCINLFALMWQKRVVTRPYDEMDAVLLSRMQSHAKGDTGIE